MAGSGVVLFFAVNAIVRRASSAHAEVVLGLRPLALLLAPKAPGDNGETTNEDGSTDATNDAANDRLGLRCQAAATAAALAALSQSGINGCGCDFGGRDDAIAGEDARPDDAILGVEGGCGVRLRGLVDNGRGNCRGRGEC